MRWIREIREKRGFTLIEVMIVVGIVAVLSTLAIQNIARSRLITNESNAINILHTLRTACTAYYGAQTPNAFAQSLEDLTLPISNPPFLDPTLIENIKFQRVYKGYYYVYVRLPNNEGFTILARPSEYGATGERSFFMDKTGQIFVTSEDREPTQSDPTL